MALQSSGPISLNDIATEFGGSTPHSLSEYYGAGGTPSSGAISLADFYGKANSKDIQILMVSQGGRGGGSATQSVAGGGGGGGLVGKFYGESIMPGWVFEFRGSPTGNGEYYLVWDINYGLALTGPRYLEYQAETSTQRYVKLENGGDGGSEFSGSDNTGGGGAGWIVGGPGQGSRGRGTRSFGGQGSAAISTPLGGGGGGAATNGQNAVDKAFAGNGGDGYQDDITGTNVWYGGGGGGCGGNGFAGYGGYGGAGRGAGAEQTGTGRNPQTVDAIHGTGGGGGGGGNTAGGNAGAGGAGVFMFRVPSGGCTVNLNTGTGNEVACTLETSVISGDTIYKITPPVNKNFKGTITF